MAETHPILEAVARAIERVVSDDMPQSCFLTTDELHAAALAAARVILSVEPSEGQTTAAEQWFMSGPSARDILSASNAALLREIEGGNG